MENSIASARICFRGADLPHIRAEEFVEVFNLVGMRNEPIYFFVNEVDEHLAASLLQDRFDEIKRHAGPTEWINECESRHKPPIALKLRTPVFKRCFEGRAALDNDTKIHWQ